jgi:hypothetical protein
LPDRICFLGRKKIKTCNAINLLDTSLVSINNDLKPCPNL